MLPILSILLLSATTVSAATFTLDSAPDHALRHNPDLRAARWRIEEARGRLRQAGRLSNPQLESEVRQNVRGREFSAGVGLVQSFPITDRLKYEKAVSEAELALAEAEVRDAERRLAAEVLTLGVNWLAKNDEQRLKEAQLKVSRELAGTAAKSSEAGETSPLEAGHFELEAQRLALDLLRLKSEKAAIAGEVRPLLGLAASSAVEFAGSLPEASTPDGRGLDPSARADFRMAVARAEAARHTLGLARVNRWEDISAGVIAEVERAEDAPEGLETDGFLGIKLSIPLPIRNRNEGKIQEAAAAAARAELEVTATAAKIRAEAAAARAEMTTQRAVVREVSSVLLPKARELEAQFSAAWQQAQPEARLADVLRAREKRLEVEQARLDALRAFHLARVRFQSALGRPTTDPKP